VKTIEPGYDATLISAQIWRDSLIIVPNKDVTAATPTTLTLKFNSNGRIVTQAVTVTVQPGALAHPVSSITLNQTTANVKTGETLQLTATVLPADADNKAVTWTSDKPYLATVDNNGLVTAILAPGTVVITATTVESGYIASCTVTTSAAAIIENPFELSVHTLTLDIAQTTQLSLTAPESYSNVTWRSLNENVAMVGSAGMVRAIAAGSTKIVAEDKTKNKADTCMVTVRPAATTYAISLNHTQLVMNGGERTVLTATVFPSNGQTVMWQSSAPSVADVTSGGTVIALVAGYATITATLPDGISATCSVTVRDVAVEAEANDITAHGATLAFPKISGASYYLVHLYEVAVNGQRTPVVALKVNPDGTIAMEVGLRASANTIHLTLNSLKSSTHHEADIEVIRDISGKAEVVSVLKAAFTTSIDTGIEQLSGAESKVYYTNGILHLVNLEGYNCSVVTISGQQLNNFRSTSLNHAQQIGLSSGIYILIAQKGDKKVFKFVVR
jgi:uncharacterized protein YjdB